MAAVVDTRKRMHDGNEESMPRCKRANSGHETGVVHADQVSRVLSQGFATMYQQLHIMSQQLQAMNQRLTQVEAYVQQKQREEATRAQFPFYN